MEMLEEMTGRQASEVVENVKELVRRRLLIMMTSTLKRNHVPQGDAGRFLMESYGLVSQLSELMACIMVAGMGEHVTGTDYPVMFDLSTISYPELSVRDEELFRKSLELRDKHKREDEVKPASGQNGTSSDG